MRMHLSTLGWINDAPRGHRLRWHHPVQSLTPAGHYVGLPGKIVVERAPLDGQDLFGHKLASAAYPYSWWSPRPDVSMSGFVPPHEVVLPGPVQAITFTYHGSPARIVVRQRTTQDVAWDRLVADGDVVYAEAPMLDSVLVYATWATLSGVRVLDLFDDHGLHFEPIAEIAVAASFGAPLATIARRYDQPVTLSAAEWAELVALAAEAQASLPATEVAGTPTAWQQLLLVLGLRWEFALLSGFAFFDGPRGDACPLDHLSGAVLHAPPATPMAYRVRDADGTAGPSNLALCAPWPATALAAPSAPWYVAPEVRLRAGKSVMADSAVLTSHASLAHYTPQLAFDGAYGVRTTMGWLQSDPRALGVEVDETVSGSPATGAAARHDTFMSRSRRLADPPLQGSLARSFDVAFPDVTLTSRVRAIDAWDRVSTWSAPSPPTSLVLRHEPPAPPLETAVYDAGTVHIARAVGRPGIPDWQPDPIVAHAAGHVRVYRRTTAPRTASVTVTAPIAASPGRYRVDVAGAAGLADFVGGTLSVGAFTESVVAAGATTVEFAVPDNGSPITLFSGGAARLAQDPLHPALWTQVASFPASALPATLVFADPLPSPAALAVESYLARVAFLGRLGPPGNVVCAIRLPVVPVVPPPFVVDVLGLDFYRRTLVKLRFTTPPGAGRYTVWWADGNVSASDFPRRGAAGTCGGQQPDGGTVLYEVLPLPIPSHVDRTITVGVQRVGDGGTQSNFVTAPVVLPALSP